ncbi:hypothetical protein GCM10028895_06530 [Pontibacter rugosus]
MIVRLDALKCMGGEFDVKTLKLFQYLGLLIKKVKAEPANLN